jgi:hypothetical protein
VKKGTSFELMTKNIFEKLSEKAQYEIVEHNVKLNGKDGPRQIDVLISAKVAGMDIKTIIECKDYNSKISVGTVDALHSVMLDVNANKAVLVSTKGFSSTAIKKAKRLGISLFTAHEALKDDWKIDLEIPVIIKEILPMDITPSFVANFKKGDSFHKDTSYVINDINILDAFKKQWAEVPITDNAFKNGESYPFEFTELSPPFYMRSSTGSKLYLDELNVSFKVQVKYYNGYLNEQENTQVLKDIIENKTNIFFDLKAIFDYEKKFKENDQHLFPENSALLIDCIAKPDFKIVSGTLEIGKSE